MKILLILLMFTFPAFQKVPAQSAGEIEVPTINQTGWRRWTSRFDPKGPVVDEETFKKFLETDDSDKDKRHRAFEDLKIDFSKQTLLTFEVRGDCFVRGKANVTRNDTLKQYTMHVTTIFGGCRAAGQYRGWLVVEKFRPDYKIITTEFKIDERDEFKNSN
ncbi:MAG TPA: hypothetical protein VGN86_00565 [Pyrinomonadaceae bacterium]|jgi:hypothetical protein|nr:hypothetical protein [Pyrinomonadaceae bacterium]